ncbi:MAG TPA: UPF0280 family protein [Albidovulum sp.]|uniref:UPF0280 family protein n=1 Tax=Albidovulum sp. TaxID=1872424 RepID=UPI002C77B2ED|nr:UPF0280 family protein [Albidovulum sp.]
MTAVADMRVTGADRAVAGRIAGSGRLRLRHGPIDVILDLAGGDAAVAGAEAAVRDAFAGLLDRLVAELPLLRAEVGATSPDPEGPVARRMMAAVRPHAARFITPMAAVAGSVADHLADVALAAAPLSRVLVNNGGDIAIRLGPGARARVAVADLGQGEFPAEIDLTAADGIGGIATSGWRGRSHSLGIADAVTILARDAASADAAATMVANAVDLPGSPAVTRAPARVLAPDSDLGDRLVTTGVATVGPADRARALAGGLAEAEKMVAAGLIRGAFLCLQGEMRVAGAVPRLEGAIR